MDILDGTNELLTTLKHTRQYLNQKQSALKAERKSLTGILRTKNELLGEDTLKTLIDSMRQTEGALTKLLRVLRSAMSETYVSGSLSTPTMQNSALIDRDPIQPKNSPNASFGTKSSLPWDETAQYVMNHFHSTTPVDQS